MSGNTYQRAISFGETLVDNGICSDLDIVTNNNPSKHFNTWSDETIIPNGGCFTLIIMPDVDTDVQDTVLANSCFRVHDNCSGMRNIQTWAKTVWRDVKTKFKRKPTQPKGIPHSYQTPETMVRLCVDKIFTLTQKTLIPSDWLRQPSLKAKAPLCVPRLFISGNPLVKITSTLYPVVIHTEPLTGYYPFSDKNESCPKHHPQKPNPMFGQ